MKVERTLTTRVEVSFDELVKALELPPGSEISTATGLMNSVMLQLKDNKLAKEMAKQVEDVTVVAVDVKEVLSAVNPTK